MSSNSHSPIARSKRLWAAARLLTAGLLAAGASQAPLIGAPGTVPAPWTPLVVRAGKVHCWGRDHRVRGGLPAQIMSQQKRLLARPVSVRLNGKRLSGARQRLLFHQARVARWEAVAFHRGTRFQTRAAVEYDGFWLFDLEVGPGAVRDLCLEIPLASAHARYLHFVNETHYQEANTLALAQRDGELWSNRFACMVWLGDERVGLAWCADTDAPFRLRRPERALTIQRASGATTLRIRLIDRPTTLKQPLRWRFGLIATPIRPLPSRWREWRLAPGASANTQIVWWNTWTGSHADPVPRDPPALAERARQARKDGQYLLPYVALLALSERTSAYRSGGDRWRREPFSRLEDEGTPYWIMCPNSPWREYLPDRMRHLFGETGANGLYYDFTFPYRCEAAHHPCGYQSPDGRRQGEFRVFATRKLLQTIYERVKAVRRDSRIMLHTSGALMYPYIGFGDMMLNGEQHRQPVTRAGGAYMDVLSLEALRSEYRGQHAGLAPFLIPELATPSGLPDPKLTAEPARTNELLALTLLHDVGIWPIYCHLGAVEAVREAQRRFGIADARFVPYWEQAGPAFLSDAGLLSSAWVRPGAVLLVVVNRGEKEAQTRLRLRSTLTGRPVVSAQDALSGIRIAVDAAGLSLVVPARGFRLLRLATGQAERS